MASKKIALFIAVCIALSLTVNPSYLYTNIASPPVMRTGAPGELTCATTDCHSGTPTFNSTSIDLEGLNTPFIENGLTAGASYNLLVRVNPNDNKRSGFQITAVDDNGDAAGTFQIVQTTNTSLASGGNGRQYLSHKNANQGINFWNFIWEAPDPAVDVYFYIAGNKSNNDSMATGADAILLRTFKATTTSFGPLTDNVGIHGPGNIDELDNINIYPNPVKEKINFDYYLTAHSDVKVELFGMNGQLVNMFNLGSNATGDHRNSLELGSGLTSGLYLLKVSIGEKLYYKKIVVE